MCRWVLSRKKKKSGQGYEATGEEKRTTGARSRQKWCFSQDSPTVWGWGNGRLPWDEGGVAQRTASPRCSKRTSRRGLKVCRDNLLQPALRADHKDGKGAKKVATSDQMGADQSQPKIDEA